MKTKMTAVKRQLSDKINSLGSTEHIEIFKILQEHGVPHSENNNGVFFNLTTLDEGILKRIHDFVNYCYENKTELDEYDKRLKECKFRNNITNIMRTPNYQSSINEPVDKKERWKELMDMVDKENSVKEFIDKINTTVDKQCARRSATKYALARKKFVKKASVEVEVKEELAEEAYAF